MTMEAMESRLWSIAAQVTTYCTCLSTLAVFCESFQKVIDSTEADLWPNKSYSYFISRERKGKNCDKGINKNWRTRVVSLGCRHLKTKQTTVHIWELNLVIIALLLHFFLPCQIYIILFVFLMSPLKQDNCSTILALIIYGYLYSTMLVEYK